jgi:hypothetical protein
MVSKLMLLRLIFHTPYCAYIAYGVDKRAGYSTDVMIPVCSVAHTLLQWQSKGKPVSLSTFPSSARNKGLRHLLD